MGLQEKIVKITPMANLLRAIFLSVLFIVGVLFTKSLVIILIPFSLVGFFHGMLFSGQAIVYMKLFGAKHFHNAIGMSCMDWFGRTIVWYVHALS